MTPQSHRAKGTAGTSVRLPTIEDVHNYEEKIYAESSPVLLRNGTIEQLKQLHRDMHLSDEEVMSYDALVLELVRVYRKTKRL